MRTKFSRDKELVPNFSGNKLLPEAEQLRYKLSPMDLGDFTEMMDRISVIKGVEQPDGTLKLDTDNIAPDAQRDFMELCQSFVPKYVVSIGARLEAADGSEVTVQDIARYSPFISLITEFVAELLSISTPTEIELGN